MVFPFKFSLPGFFWIRLGFLMALPVISVPNQVYGIHLIFKGTRWENISHHLYKGELLSKLYGYLGNYSIDSIGKPAADSGSNRQNTRKKKNWEIIEKGISVGYGYGINNNNLPEGSYSPIFFIRTLAVDFPHINDRLPPRVKISIIFEPQANLVLLRKPDSTKVEFELGIGVGIQNRFLITKKISTFYHLIVGPQYFSTSTIRQTKGLIFSDNLGLGFSYLIDPHWMISSEFRIRHMSNANIVQPNYGINTNNFLLNFSRVIR